MSFGLVCRRQMCSMTDDHTCLQKSPSFPAQRCPESRSLGVDPDAEKTRHKLRCLTQWSLSYGDARPTRVLCLQSFFSDAVYALKPPSQGVWYCWYKTEAWQRPKHVNSQLS